MGFANMRIGARLALGFGLMAVLIVLIGVTALFKASAIDTEFRSVTDERMPRVEVLNDVKGHVYQIGMSLLNISSMTSPPVNSSRLRRVKSKPLKRRKSRKRTAKIRAGGIVRGAL